MIYLILLILSIIGMFNKDDMVAGLSIMGFFVFGIISAFPTYDYFYEYSYTKLSKQRMYIEHYDKYVAYKTEIEKTPSNLIESRDILIFRYNKALVETKTKKKQILSYIFGFAFMIQSEVLEMNLYDKDLKE